MRYLISEYSAELLRGASSTAFKEIYGPSTPWSIGVGLVISGEYFGWSYGWGIAGILGFLFSTLFVSLMYTTLVFSFTELTTAIPNAGGPFEYARVALATSRNQTSKEFI